MRIMQALPGSSSRLALGSVPALVIYRPHLALASFCFVVVVVSSGMRRSPIHCSLPILVKSPGVSHAQYPADRLLVLKVDVTIHSDIIAAFEKTREVFGCLNVVVSNAGYAVLGEVEDTPDDVARALFEVNFWGSVHVMQEAVKFFREVNAPGKGGRVIQISSVMGIVGFPACGFYNATKFAIEGITEVLAKEFDPAWNIKITDILLGAFLTQGVPSMVKARKAMLASLKEEKDPNFEIN
ncbi:hypothetical protein VTO73DRAFT_4071 [Trametes versicolor]